jgi:hypothetical protein
MIPIYYEEVRTSIGMPVVKAYIRLNGGTKVVYGRTKAEAREKLIDWMSDYDYDLAPESFVTLPGPDLSGPRPPLRRNVVDGLTLMILAFVVAAALSFLSQLIDGLIK